MFTAASHIFALLKFNPAITAPVVGDIVRVPSELVTEETAPLARVAATQLVPLNWMT